MAERHANQYSPTKVSPRGTTLRELLELRRISRARLAECMGLPKKTIDEIIRGKTAIDPETALELEGALGVEAEFWNRREQQYQDYLARMQETAK
jgi:HTH-type transcriptional regulator/antitoxin HigA